MPKSIPLFESMPDYMAKLSLSGARFVEGNDGSGSAASGSGASGDEGKPEGQGKPADGSESGNDGGDFKSKESKDAVMADLTQERNERKRLQGEVTERDTQISTLTETVSTHEATIAERDQTIADRDTEISVLNLAMVHGLSAKDDLDLIRDASKENRATLAERLAKSNSKSSVVRKSGGGSADDHKGGGSISEHRRQIAERNKK